MQPDLISEWSWGFDLIDWFDFSATFTSLAKHSARHANKKRNGHKAGSQKERVISKGLGSTVYKHDNWPL